MTVDLKPEWAKTAVPARAPVQGKGTTVKPARSPMRRQMVLEGKTGRTRHAAATQPLVSSAGAPWEGVLLERHRLGALEINDVVPLQHTLFLHFAPVTEFEWLGHSNGVRITKVSSGQFNIAPAMRSMSFRSPALGEFIAVTLEPTFVDCAISELISPGQLELDCHSGVTDPLLHATVLALEAEVKDGNPGGRCYGQTLANTLAVHLVRRYARLQPREHDLKGGLAPFQLRRVMDYVAAHFAEDVSLNSLAAIAGLSPFHFARLFKASTGIAPHQYVIQQRVERARQLLLRSDLPLSEVALQVGFCDQSHFAAHFKRAYGTTPRMFVRRMKVEAR